MSAEPRKIASTDPWTQWESQVVNGAFPLRGLLACTPYSAVFLTELKAKTRTDAAIKFVRADASQAKAQLEQWQAAAALSHPNLLRLFATGRCQLDGHEYLFVVMEHAEQTLAQILGHRALTADEVQELLPPTLEALTFLHRRNLVHGRMKPSNFLAVGDQLKLASDTVRPAGRPVSSIIGTSSYDAPELKDHGLSTAGDLWSFGLTLVEALTQRAPTGPEQRFETASLPPGVPAPVVDTVRRCLSLAPADRPTVIELRAQYKIAPPAASTPASEPSPQQAHSTSTPQPPAQQARPTPAPQPPAQQAQSTSAPQPSAPQAHSMSQPQPPSRQADPMSQPQSPARKADSTSQTQPPAPQARSTTAPQPAAPQLHSTSQPQPSARQADTVSRAQSPARPVQSISQPQPPASQAHSTKTPQPPASQSRSTPAPQSAAPQAHSTRAPQAPTPQAHSAPAPQSAASQAHSTSAPQTPTPQAHATPAPQMRASQAPATPVSQQLAPQVRSTTALQAAAPQAHSISQPQPARHADSILKPQPQARQADAISQPQLPARQVDAIPQPQLPIQNAPAATAAPTPATAPRDATPQSSPKRKLELPIIAAALLIPVAVWVGLRFTNTSEAPSQPPVVAAPVTPPTTTAPAAPDSKLSSPVYSPAEQPSPTATSPDVLHEVMPDVPQDIREKIKGRIYVTVRVLVDPSGNVMAALIDDSGPSKYFARLADNAAREWQFVPTEEQDTRVWLVRFEFTRAGVAARTFER